MLNMYKLDIKKQNDIETLEYCCRTMIPINIDYLLSDPELDDPIRGIYVFSNDDKNIIGCIFLSSLDYELCQIYKSIFNQYPEIDANNVAYSVHKKYQKQGYGTEMLSIFLEFLNENHINYNFLVENHNIASIRLLEKNNIFLTKPPENNYAGFNQSEVFFVNDKLTF